jgi:hypothetical protein
MTANPSRADDNLKESYATWALECFERRIQPLLREEERAILDGVHSSSWLSTCEPA